MTIYVTAFKADDLDNPEKSIDSGFTSLMSVMKSIGYPDFRPAPNVLIYGKGNDRVVFSQVAFNIDQSDIKEYYTKKRGAYL